MEFVPDITCNSLEDFENHIPFYILYSILCEYKSIKLFAIYENKRMKLTVRLNSGKKLVYFFEDLELFFEQFVIKE